MVARKKFNKIKRKLNSVDAQERLFQLEAKREIDQETSMEAQVLMCLNVFLLCFINCFFCSRC
jgi:hypothetical protein